MSVRCVPRVFGFAAGPRGATWAATFLLACAPNFSDADDDDDAGRGESTAELDVTDATSSGNTTGPTPMTTGEGSTADMSGETGIGTTVAAETMAPGDCQLDELCAPVVPRGWDGPFALRTSDAGMPDCGGKFPRPYLHLGQDLSGGGHECSCACGPARNVECAETTTLRYHWGSAAGCQLGGIPEDVGPTCLGLGGDGWYRADPFEVSDGVCAPLASNRIGEAEFSEHAVLCGVDDGRSLSQCGGGGVCTPEPDVPFDAQFCIARAAAPACPPDYPEKSEYYAGFADERGCAACSCGSASGTCEGIVGLYLGGTCTADPIELLAADDQCVGVTEIVGSARPVSTRPGQASCTASPGQTVGQLATVDPVTVCCGSTTDGR